MFFKVSHAKMWWLVIWPVSWSVSTYVQDMTFVFPFYLCLPSRYDLTEKNSFIQCSSVFITLKVMACDMTTKLNWYHRNITSSHTEIWPWCWIQNLAFFPFFQFTHDIYIAKSQLSSMSTYWASFLRLISKTVRLSQCIDRLFKEIPGFDGSEAFEILQWITT